MFRADGDMTKLIVVFPNFLKAPKRNYREDGEDYLMKTMQFSMCVPRRHGGSGGIAPFILTPSTLFLGRNCGTHCIEGCWASEPVWTIWKRDVDLLHILKGLKLKRVLVPSFLFFSQCETKNTFFSSNTTSLANKFLSFTTATFLGFYTISHGPGSNPGGDEILRPSRPALGPTHPPVQ